MTPDEKIAEIFRLREEYEPDADPGDITINIQDDTPMVNIYQRDQWIGVGGTLDSALDDALLNIRNNRTCFLAGHQPLNTMEKYQKHRKLLSEILKRPKTT